MSPLVTDCTPFSAYNLVVTGLRTPTPKLDPITLRKFISNSLSTSLQGYATIHEGDSVVLCGCINATYKQRFLDAGIVKVTDLIKSTSQQLTYLRQNGIPSVYTYHTVAIQAIATPDPDKVVNHIKTDNMNTSRYRGLWWDETEDNSIVSILLYQNSR